MRNLKDFAKMKYHNLYGDLIGDINDVRTMLFDVLDEEYKKYNKIITKVIFGTDTKSSGKKTRFSTALALRIEGHGVRVIRCRYTTDIIQSDNERLMLEAIRSNEFSLMFVDILDHFAIIPDIHVDVNENERHKSNKIMKQVFSFVESQGNHCVFKPNAWVSSKVCDRVVNKGSWRDVK